MTRWRELRTAVDGLARASGVEALVGKPTVLAARVRERARPIALPTALERMATLAPDGDDPPADSPLFVFSAGWRSGSTLLQRLIVSAGTDFLWGEPYNRCNYVPRLADSLRVFATDWPEPGYIYRETSADAGGGASLADQWIANLFPSGTALIEAHRAFWRRLFVVPGADASGEVQWGFKEVRLPGEYALYLQMLFPRARFIFLVRDPFDAYESYRADPSWYALWPSQQVRTPRMYAKTWQRLALSFLAVQARVSGLLVRYEDLVDGGDAVDRLEQALGRPVDRSVLTRRIGSTSAHAGTTGLERRIVARYTAQARRELGYPTPSR